METASPGEPTGIKNWKNNFPDYFTDWEKRFSFIYKSTKDNKLRQFSFRLLHRITTTKKELFKFRLVEDEAYTLCLLPDSIEHIYTFLDCTVTTAFYSKAISWINHENDTHITLSSKQVTFNDIPRLTHLTDYRLRRRPHLFVIILKQYIYACKCLVKKPNMQEFQRKGYTTMANGEMRSSLSHRFSRKVFFSDLTGQLKQTH